jgi:predicted nucleotidyltransferase component of viral defense system
VLTRSLITRRASRDLVDAATAERDYVLAHVVAQLHLATSKDGARLVFKGGTALRFVYFEDYRYSADLDFSVTNGDVATAFAALGSAVAAARAYAGFSHLELVDGKHRMLSYLGPLGGKKPHTLKVDLSGDEYVDSIRQGVVLATWADLPEPAAFDVYPLEEITAEKLRCVMQRMQCRDIYDLFRLTEDARMPLAELRPLFEAKARTKNLDPGGFAKCFEERIQSYRRSWDREMGRHLAEPPPFQEVERVIRRHLRGSGYLTS